MGRRKISITPIADSSVCHATFNKRKNGLVKKAAELSVLCNVNVLLMFEDGNGSLIRFSRDGVSSVQEFLNKCKFNKTIDLCGAEYPNFFAVNHYKKGKGVKIEEDDDDEIVQKPVLRTKSQARNFTQMDSDSTSSEYEPPKGGNKNQKDLEVAIKNLREHLQFANSGSENSTLPIPQLDGVKKQKRSGAENLRLSVQKEPETTMPSNQKPQFDFVQPSSRKISERDGTFGNFFLEEANNNYIAENSPYKAPFSSGKFFMTPKLTQEDVNTFLKSSTTPFNFSSAVQGLSPFLKNGPIFEFDEKKLNSALLTGMNGENRVFTFMPDGREEPSFY